MRKSLTGAVLGATIGVIDCVLFLALGETVTTAMAIGAIAFWTTVGWAVHLADTNIRGAAKGAAISLFMNVPWIVEFALVQQQPGFAVPMIAISVVFGAVLGILSNRLGSRPQLGSNVA